MTQLVKTCGHKRKHGVVSTMNVQKLYEDSRRCGLFAQVSAPRPYQYVVRGDEYFVTFKKNGKLRVYGIGTYSLRSCLTSSLLGIGSLYETKSLTEVARDAGDG